MPSAISVEEELNQPGEAPSPEDEGKRSPRSRKALTLVETVIRDVRFAWRGLWRSPGFTAAVIVSLTLGIGANTAIFSLFNTLMLRTLPVREPEQLALLYRTGGWGNGFTSYPLYREMQKQADLFDGVLARTAPWRVRYSMAADSERPAFLLREFVSTNYFEVLGVRSAIGHLFAGDDGAPQSQPYAVISYDFWQTRFHADAGVLGRQFVLDDRPLTIVGVAPKGFRGVQVEGGTDVWVPLTMSTMRLQDSGAQWLWLLARRRHAVAPEQVQAKLDVLVRNFFNVKFGGRPDSVWRRKMMEQRLQVRAGGMGVSFLRDEFQKPLQLLMGLVGLVLLIACSNVANLLLSRGATRRHETALRVSLGAGNYSLVWQSLIETSLLTGIGMVAGILVGLWGSGHIVKFLPSDPTALPLEVRPDINVLIFTVLVSATAALLSGILPAFRATDVQPNTILRESSAGSGRRQGQRMRKVLVVTQVALSVVLLCGAILFSRSLRALNSTDTGFRNYDVLSCQLDAPRSYKTSQTAAVRERWMERLRAIPAITAVSSGFPGPYRGGGWTAKFRVHGSERTAAETATIELQAVSAGYFADIGNALIRGRHFQSSDTEYSRRVAIVNEAFAREYLKGRDPVGSTISFDEKEPQAGASLDIVGQVRNMLHSGVRETPTPTIYLPIAQEKTTPDAVVLIRSGMNAGALTPVVMRELGKLDPSVTLSDIRTLRERFDDSIYLDRMIAAVSVLLAALSLILAGLGIYGVLAYTVAQRRAEIGIRVALGAEPRAILWLVLRDALALVTVGASVGIPLAVAGGRFAAGLLFSVRPADPFTYIASTVFVLLISAVAAAIPGRRAALLEPMNAIRS